MITPPAVAPPWLGQQRFDTGPGLVGELMPANHHPSLDHTGGRSPGQALIRRSGYSDLIFHLPEEARVVMVNAADAEAVPATGLWGQIVTLLYPDSLPSW